MPVPSARSCAWLAALLLLAHVLLPGLHRLQHGHALGCPAGTAAASHAACSEGDHGRPSSDTPAWQALHPHNEPCGVCVLLAKLRPLVAGGARPSVGPVLASAGFVAGPVAGALARMLRGQPPARGPPAA